jgi:general secretion pathway protein E
MRFADDSFGRLGMAEATRGLLRDALAAGQGLIIFAGPRGSGRSATLSAALDDAPEAMIADEIRDAESAEAAMRAAASRLVFAPILAGHAVGVISRLRDCRIDPLAIAARLKLVIAQRLMRRLCPECRAPEQACSSVSALLGFDPGTFVYVPRGCGFCDGKGHLGRIGLFEALPVDGAIRHLIAMDGDEAVIASHAFRDRPNLSGAARILVRDGLIGAEEAVSLSRTPVRELVYSRGG